MKPWLSHARGRQLEAFLGCWGIRTSDIETTEDLIADACTLYQIEIRPTLTVDNVAEKIEALGKKERKFLAMKNLGMFPDREAKRTTKSPITQEALVEAIGKETPKIVSGAGQDCVGELDIDPARLLKKVVASVIGYGQGHILWEYPELLEFLGSRIPSRKELEGHTGIDERMYEAKARWPNLKAGTEL